MEIKTKFKKGQKVVYISQAYDLKTLEGHWIVDNREYIFDKCCGYKNYGWKYELKTTQCEHIILEAFEQNCFATKEEAQKECDKRNGKEL